MLKRLEHDKTLNAVLENPYLLKAERCRRDFYYFVKQFWSTIIEEDPVYNWHIKYLCDELQKIGHTVIQKKDKEYDLIVNIPPGTTKSTICSEMFHAWLWIARVPNDMDKTGAFIRIISGSFKDEIATELAEFAKDIIMSDKYQLYFPELVIRKDKSAKTNYKNTEGGQRSSTSVGTSPMGKHAHVIIIDDPVDPEQALSDLERDKANRWCDNVAATRKVNKRVTVTIMIMQRLHKVDPTGHWVSRHGDKIKQIILPGIIKYGDTKYRVHPPELERFYKNGLLDPNRMSNSVLEEMRQRLGPYGFSAQIGQDPRNTEDGMFQRDYFEIVDSAPYGGTKWVRGWDLAATSEKEAKKNKIQAAYTAGLKMKYCNGIFYIGHVARKRVADPRAIMRNTASQDEKGTIVDFPQDPGSAGKVQARSIAAHMVGFDCRYSVESGEKMLRAAPFSSQCAAGNVKLVRGEWNEEFLEEGEFYPNGFKDQIDGGSRAFNRLTKEIASEEYNDDDFTPTSIPNDLHQTPEGDYY